MASKLGGLVPGRGDQPELMFTLVSTAAENGLMLAFVDEFTAQSVDPGGVKVWRPKATTSRAGRAPATV